MLFDYYELRARIVPATIVAAPTVLPPLAHEVRAAGGWMWTSVAATTLLAAVYALSFVVRFLGKKLEPRLWNSWGGPPSTLVLAQNDSVFPATTKQLIYEAVRHETQFVIDPVEAASEDWRQLTSEAFRLVRQYLRRRDPKGIWYAHNAEYGMLRNLYGGTPVMATFATISLVWCGIVAWDERTSLTVFLVAIAALALLLALVARRYLLPELLRAAAVQYAESAWSCFLASTTGSNVPRENGGAP